MNETIAKLNVWKSANPGLRNWDIKVDSQGFSSIRLYSGSREIRSCESGELSAKVDRLIGAIALADEDAR